MVTKIHTFQNCASTIEDLPNPETGNIDGRAFVIIDNDTGDVYRYPMPIDVAKTQGERLMGLGGIEVANGKKLKEELAQRGHMRPKR